MFEAYGKKVGFILFIGLLNICVYLCLYLYGWELDIDVAKHNL